MKKITALLLTTVTCAMLGACGGGGESAEDPPVRIGDVLVFESRQSIQCGTRGLTTQQSAQKLINGGIDVLESSCAAMTGFAYATVCGNGTGDILIHRIRRANLEDAEERGFVPVDELRDPLVGSGYVRVDCDTGALLP